MLLLPDQDQLMLTKEENVLSLTDKCGLLSKRSAFGITKSRNHSKKIYYTNSNVILRVLFKSKNSFIMMYFNMLFCCRLLPFVETAGNWQHVVNRI